ncbi:MAG TPA: MFS transporter [Pseudonocardia sp.]|jgi:CP family cyanate transporter-like MFS transporter|nr:MFS transporter [Pseudonocardia sp.]
MSSGQAPPGDVGTGPVRPVVVLVGLLALALNLRAALAGYPPLLETVRADLGTSFGAAGLVQAGAVLMMAVGSFVGPRIGDLIGREIGLGAAVALVGAGSLVRGVPTMPTLVAGSLVIGLGIGISGVLITGVVKEHLGRRAGAATGGYTVAMMIGATAASALSVPVAVLLGGWSVSLALLAVPAVLAVAIWLPIARRMPRVRAGGHRSPVPWRDPFARLIACYMAGTSTMFYGWITWLAPYYERQGWSPQQAGLLLAVWSVAQMPAGLFVPALAERRRRWRFWSGLTLASGLGGTLGAMLLPMPPLVGPWLWVVLIGFGLGSSFPLGLAVIAWRTPHGAGSAATSGLALGVGYSSAGIGPLVMGVLIDVTGAFTTSISLLLAAGCLQAWAIYRIGDDPGR